MESIVEWIGYAFGITGALLMFASYMMKSMLPLRLVALVASLCAWARKRLALEFST